MSAASCRHHVTAARNCRPGRRLWAGNAGAHLCSGTSVAGQTDPVSCLMCIQPAQYVRHMDQCLKIDRPGAHRVVGSCWGMLLFQQASSIPFMASFCFNLRLMLEKHASLPLRIPCQPSSIQMALGKTSQAYEAVCRASGPCNKCIHKACL